MEKKDNLVSDADQIGTEIIESMQHPVKTIYMDSDFLYDYRLGSLLLLIKGEKDYEYVIKQLDAYECNPSLKITDSFPELNLTEEDVDQVEYDLERQTHLNVISPKTGLLEDLNDFLASVNTYNRSQTDTTGVTLIVNCRRHLMPDFVWDQLVDYVNSADKSITLVKTTFRDWDEVPNEDFNKFDMVFVYDMINFARSQLFRTKAQSMSTINKLMFAFPQLEKERKTPEEAKEAFENFENVMNVIFSKFSYIRKTISRKQ